MRAGRIVAIVVAACVAVIALMVCITTGIGVAGSVHGGMTEMALRFGEGYSRSSGPNNEGVHVQSVSTLAIVSIPGLSPFATGLHLTAGILAALAPLAIAAFALLIGVGLWRGRPFAARIARGLVISAVLLLVLTIAAQLIGWASRLVAMSEFENDYPQLFSPAPEFDPLLTATAVGLLIVAIAFRLGSHADRSTEGLV
jgi:hypothetical protein